MATLEPEPTQQSGQTPDKEVEIKNITIYVNDYTATDTTGMLSPQTVWRFTVAADINSNAFDFYFLIWSLSRLLCCVGSGFNVAAALCTRPLRNIRRNYRRVKVQLYTFVASVQTVVRS